jgi:hypothetical protein
VEDEQPTQDKMAATQRYRDEMFDRLARMDARLDHVDVRLAACDSHAAALDIVVAQLKLGMANLEEWQRRQNGTLQTLEKLSREQTALMESLIRDTNKRIDDLNTRAVQVLAGVVVSGLFMLLGIILSQAARLGAS